MVFFNLANFYNKFIKNLNQITILLILILQKINKFAGIKFQNTYAKDKKKNQNAP